MAPYVAAYLLAINGVSMAVYGWDKRAARRDRRRVPERRLFLLAILGGSLGALLGMRLFRHKTKHWYFVWGIPAILVLQVLLTAWLWYGA